MRLSWAPLLALAVACGGQIDPTAMEKTNTPQPSPDGNPPTSDKPPTSTTVTPPGGTGAITGCSGTVTRFEEDFENGLGERFKFSSKSSYSVEYEAPIIGLQSLRVTSGSTVYMTHPMGSACSASVTFMIKASAETIKSGMVLANLDAGSREITISMAPGDGTVSVLESVKFHNGGGGGGGPVVKTPFLPDVPMVVRLAVDLTAETLDLQVGSEIYGAPLMPGVEDMDAPAFKTLAIGNGPTGIMGSTGLYVLDSIVVE